MLLLATVTSTSIWAKPTSESTVDVSFTTASGEVKSLPVPHSDIEPGNARWIAVDLTTSEARNVEHDVELY